MRVLLLTNQVPFSSTSGYPIVVYNTIKGLLAQGAEVAVFSLNPQTYHIDIRTIDDPLLKQITLATASINTNLSTWNLLINMFKGRAANVSRFYKSASVAKLKNFLKHHKFDIIQLEGLFVMPYLSVIRQYSKAKIIYRAHNLEHQVGELLASTERSPLRRLYRQMAAKRLYKFEIANMNKPDAILTLNESDKSHLQFLGCTVHIHSFPVAIDLENYHPDFSQMEFPSIFHIGSMDFAPNVDSLNWFINTVWKDLQALNIGLTLHLAARDMPPDFLDDDEYNIKLYHNVGDARQFMNSKAIMIVPLRSVSGMRVRIIEAMAMKKCIISTSLGADGIRYQHGKNILIADTADEFYKYILKCTTDRKFCETIGENARKLVEREYDISSTSHRLMAFYKKLAVNNAELF
ncbi:glycosyltransferase family 4 protein [Pedobacter sp. BS3]|uniref:glycosyltransferase family 4 protein n=1 Tax=Pedobacter sp. BS3 TaxID=2567937 RepID=UPI0011EC96BC|nr:glycosyltransferase family 4 protein [Pedobacter sp. BS3]TZF82126.1 glycosyltransferase family 4 protein [Pedobacter sp. BS3]